MATNKNFQMPDKNTMEKQYQILEILWNNTKKYCLRPIDGLSIHDTEEEAMQYLKDNGSPLTYYTILPIYRLPIYKKQ